MPIFWPLDVQPVKKSVAAASSSHAPSSIGGKSASFVFKLTTTPSDTIYGMDKVSAAAPQEVSRRAHRQQRFISSCGDDNEVYRARCRGCTDRPSGKGCYAHAKLNVLLWFLYLLNVPLWLLSVPRFSKKSLLTLTATSMVKRIDRT